MNQVSGFDPAGGGAWYEEPLFLGTMLTEWVEGNWGRFDRPPA